MGLIEEMDRKGIVPFFCKDDDDGLNRWGVIRLAENSAARFPDGRMVEFRNVPLMTDCEVHCRWVVIEGDRDDSDPMWIKGRRVELDTRKRCAGCGCLYPGLQENRICGPCHNIGLRFGEEFPAIDSLRDRSVDHQDHIDRIVRYQLYLSIKQELSL